MKILKRVAAVMISAAMVMGLSGCNEVEKAENTLNSTMSALQTGDFLTASDYIKNTEVLTSNETFNTYKDNAEFTKAIFTKLSYKINSAEKIDSSTVKMNVEITNVNMKNVLSSAISDLFTLAFSNAFAPAEEQMSDEDMQNKMIELIAEGINAEGAEPLTNTVDVNAVKTDDGWKIDADNTVIDAVTGGLLSAVESMGSALGE